nr:hypothetical protein CFP56_36750 [Quercus suber]
MGLSNKVGNSVWIDYHGYTQVPKSLNKQRLLLHRLFVAVKPKCLLSEASAIATTKWEIVRVLNNRILN